MLLDQVFNSVEYVKTIWVRRDGKLEAITKPVTFSLDPAQQLDKPLFPISKERE
jgi:hypothetical protein